MMSEIHVVIDGRKYRAEPDESVLEVAIRNHIFIPHLCFLPGIEDGFAGCRLCFAEVDGKPVASCTETVRDGLTVRTGTEIVRRLQRSALRLILSAHRIDCKRCHANRRCPLQDLARALNVRMKVAGLRDLSSREPPDGTLRTMIYDPGKCVLCGLCVRISRQRGLGVFHFARRGLETRIVLFPENGDHEAMEECLARCPAGALIPSGEEKRGAWKQGTDAGHPG